MGAAKFVRASTSDWTRKKSVAHTNYLVPVAKLRPIERALNLVITERKQPVGPRCQPALLHQRHS